MNTLTEEGKAAVCIFNEQTDQPNVIRYLNVACTLFLNTKDMDRKVIYAEDVKRLIKLCRGMGIKIKYTSDSKFISIA